MRPALAHVPRPGPLGEGGALAATAYLGSLGLAALVASNPIVIAGAGAGVAVAGLCSGAGPALRLAARWALGLGIFLILVNGLGPPRGGPPPLPRLHPPPLGPPPHHPP